MTEPLSAEEIVALRFKPREAWTAADMDAMLATIEAREAEIAQWQASRFDAEQKLAKFIASNDAMRPVVEAALRWHSGHLHSHSVDLDAECAGYLSLHRRSVMADRPDVRKSVRSGKGDVRELDALRRPPVSVSAVLGGMRAQLDAAKTENTRLRQRVQELVEALREVIMYPLPHTKACMELLDPAPCNCGVDALEERLDALLAEERA